MSFDKVPNFLVNLFDAEMNSNETLSYRFNSFLLDVAERQLFHDDKPVPLTPKAFDVLVYLVEHGGHLVLKDELMQAVWPDSFVDEVNLPRTIHTIRGVLREDGSGGKFIETVPTKGYRFVATVNKVSEPPTPLLPEEGWPKTGVLGAGGVPVADETGFSPITKLKHKTRIILFTVGFISAICLILLLSFNFQPKSSVSQNEIKSIAVLPLKPLTAENRDSGYELGIADSLIFKISAAKQMIVRSLGATSQYTDIGQDPLAAGREQKVDYVLASNYQIANGKIRITSQLYNVQSGLVEGSFKVEQENSTLFSVQDAVAANIGGPLLKTLNREPNLVAKHYTTSEDAYRLYLQGTVLADKRGQQTLTKAVEYFEKAIAIDPNYALAYAGLANAHNGLAILSGHAHDEYLKARAAVDKALAIDGDLAEAHAYIGEMKLNYEWDFAGAEVEIKKAIELDPNSSNVHRMYAIYLYLMSRSDESIAEIKTAIDLEPASVLNQTIYEMVLYFARRYDEAITQGQLTVEMDPEFPMAYGWLIRSYQMKGDDYNQFEWSLRSPRLRVKNPDKIPLWKETYSRSGWRGILKQELAETKERGKKGEGVCWELADLYTELGDKEGAIACLETIFRYNEHGWRQMAMTIDPRFDPLRSDPRFDDLVRRIGLK